jgi:hypothetical protein
MIVYMMPGTWFISFGRVLNLSLLVETWFTHVTSADQGHLAQLYRLIMVFTDHNAVNT